MRSSELRRRVVDEFVAGLPPATHVVAEVDHPYLLHGPDLLVARDGSLSAVFAERTSENVASVLARLGLARIALPPHTDAVLIVVSDRLHLQTVAPHFDRIVDGRGPTSSWIDRSQNSASKVDVVPAAVRAKRFDRAARLLQTRDDLMKLMGADDRRKRTRRRKTVVEELAARPGNSEAELIPLGALGENRPRTAVTRKGVAFLTVPTNLRRRPVSGWERPITDSVSHAFAIDSGVLYERERGALSVLVASADSSPSHDPLKSSRAAALAGAVIVPELDADLLEVFSDRLGAALEAMW